MTWIALDADRAVRPELKTPAYRPSQRWRSRPGRDDLDGVATVAVEHLGVAEPLRLGSVDASGRHGPGLAG